MLRLLAAHKPSRLIFAVLTLSIAIAGVFATLSLSHNAMRAFDRQLALAKDDQFLINGRFGRSEIVSNGMLDDQALDRRIDTLIAGLIPADLTAFRVQFRQSDLTLAGQTRPVRLLQASRSFLDEVGVTPAPDAGWGGTVPQCLVDREFAAEHFSQPVTALQFGSRRCVLAGQVDIPDVPPFIGLSDTILVSSGLSDLATDVPVGWSVYLKGPPGTTSTADLQTDLSRALNVTHLDIWSGVAIAQRAARLTDIVGLIANGLSFVILLVGGSAIASLMSFSVSERSREIAIKRTIGASRLQIVAEMVGEALLIGVIAIALGLIGGYGLTLYLEQPLGEFLDDTVAAPLTLTVPFVQTVVLFLALCGLAGSIPAWRVASREPAVILRAA